VLSHQAGHVTSTRAYLPVALKAYVAVESEEHGREPEAYCKSGLGKTVALKRLIRRSSRPAPYGLQWQAELCLRAHAP